MIDVTYVTQAAAHMVFLYHGLKRSELKLYLVLHFCTYFGDESLQSCQKRAGYSNFAQCGTHCAKPFGRFLKCTTFLKNNFAEGTITIKPVKSVTFIQLLFEAIFQST